MIDIKSWWARQWQKITPEQQRRDLISDKRKNIIKSLRDELTASESIDLFTDMSDYYRLKMAEKLVEVAEEKNKLEEFLQL